MRWMLPTMAIMIIATGCGNDLSPIQTAPVAGTATYQGKPLNEYVIYFYVPDANVKVPATGSVGSDGTFTMGVRAEGGGAIVGMNQVWLKYEPELPEIDASGPLNKTPLPQPKVKIPEKYTSRDTSGITVEVPPEGLENYELKLK